MDLSVLRDQVELIRKEVGLFSGSAFLEESVEQMNALAIDTRISVDLFLSGACRALISPSNLSIYPSLDIELITQPSQLGCVIGLRKAAIAVFACLSDEIPSTLVQQAVWRFFCSQFNGYGKCRLVVIGASSDERIDVEVLGINEPEGIELVRIASSADLSTALAGLDGPLLERQAFMHKLLSASPVVDRVKSIVASEMTALTLRRQIIVSEQDRGRRADSGSMNDAQSMVRNVLQKNFQDTERVFRQKYEELCRPNVGDMAKLIDEHANLLTPVHIIKVDKAANFEKYEAQIDSNFLNSGVSKLKHTFRQEMNKDAMFIKQLAQDTESGVATALQQIGLPRGVLDNMVRPKLDLAKLDQSHFRITKDYKGELTKPGVMEYFGALRDYTGLIMVIVGILAPLTMLATAPDADKGSVLEFINQFSGSLKNVRAYIQFFTIILIFSMLAYGIFDLRRRIPNKRRQELEKEIREARGFVSDQMSRLLSDAHRDWSAVLGQYVKDYTQALQAEVDVLIKKQTSSMVDTNVQKRSAAQLEQTSVEHKLKSFAVAERAVENLVRRFQDTIDRLQASLTSRAGAGA
jgi:hypothetical protein